MKLLRGRFGSHPSLLIAGGGGGRVFERQRGRSVLAIFFWGLWRGVISWTQCASI